MSQLAVANVEEASLNNFSGKVSCTVFTLGCNLRCRFCYNRGLVLNTFPSMEYEDIVKQLEKVKTKNIVILGGEPLIQYEALRGFLEYLKKNGFLVKLDTNGTFPEKLDKLINDRFVDYVAVDIKGFNREDFEYITRSKIGYEQFFETVRVLEKGDVDFELRYTIWKIPDENSVLKWMDEFGRDKIYHLYLQRFEKNNGLLDKRFNFYCSNEDLKSFINIFDKRFKVYLR